MSFAIFKVDLVKSVDRVCLISEYRFTLPRYVSDGHYSCFNIVIAASDKSPVSSTQNTLVSAILSVQETGEVNTDGSDVRPCRKDCD